MNFGFASNALGGLGGPNFGLDGPDDFAAAGGGGGAKSGIGGVGSRSSSPVGLPFSSPLGADIADLRAAGGGFGGVFGIHGGVAGASGCSGEFVVGGAFGSHNSSRRSPRLRPLTPRPPRSPRRSPRLCPGSDSCFALPRLSRACPPRDADDAAPRSGCATSAVGFHGPTLVLVFDFVALSSFGCTVGIGGGRAFDGVSSLNGKGPHFDGNFDVVCNQGPSTLDE